MTDQQRGLSRRRDIAEREQEFATSLQDWGLVFMLAVWLQSIMVSAIAKKRSDGCESEYLKNRDCLMEDERLTTIWKCFKREFPGEITKQEELTACMIILIRHQLAHCFVASSNQHALFLPRKSSKQLLCKLRCAGWIEPPDSGTYDPEMLIMREGDRGWFDRNREMILTFAENTILRLTRCYGIADGAIC